MPECRYYVTGNTSVGFVNYAETNLEGIESVLVLKHPSVRLKTAVLKGFMTYFQGHDLEILESALATRYLDGVIIRGRSLALLDERITPSGATSINLEETFPVSDQDFSEVNYLTQQAYDNFAAGLKVHDELEEVYINQMDFDYADTFTTNFIANMLKDVPNQSNASHTYHRLFGTNTADGVVNVVPELVGQIKHVYYIKGRAGTGKSTFMKKIAAACEEYGFDVELYHCSFDPNSIDMVLVRGLDFCIFDSTDPHEFFPQRDGESVVDLYEELVTPGTDDTYETVINKLNRRYKAYMKEGISCLKEADRKLDKIENHMMAPYTNESVQKMAGKIVAEI